MKRSNGRHKYILLCVLVAILAGVGVSYAAYTSVASIRRVITTKKVTDLLYFSSNHMIAYPIEDDSKITTKVISFSDTDFTKINITVCNYPQTSSNRVCKKDIVYSFSATLLDTDGKPLTEGTNKDLVSFFSVEKNGDGNYKSFSITNGQATFQGQTLPAKVRTQDVFSIYLPKEYLEQVTILVKAVPEDAASSEATKQNALGRVLAPMTSVNQSSYWTGSFTDDLAQTDSKSLYGFNYVVSGAGEGYITITWNAEYLKLSSNFLTMYDAFIEERSISSEQKMNYIKLHVGGLDSNDNFSMQFYRTKAAPKSEGWSATAGIGGSVVPDSALSDGAYISYAYQPKE